MNFVNEKNCFLSIHPLIILRLLHHFFHILFAGYGCINLRIARIALEALNIDKFGLDEIDNKILSTIIDKFKGGPVGINTIATAIGEDGGTVEEVYEPFLIKEGFIKRTPRGREATELAYKLKGCGVNFDKIPLDAEDCVKMLEEVLK